MTQRSDTLSKPIIIADDDNDDLELLAMALQNILGDFWHVIKVNSGKELLSLLEDKSLFPALL